MKNKHDIGVSQNLRLNNNFCDLLIELDISLTLDLSNYLPIYYLIIWVTIYISIYICSKPSYGNHFSLL